MHIMLKSFPEYTMREIFHPFIFFTRETIIYTQKKIWMKMFVLAVQTISFWNLTK